MTYARLPERFPAQIDHLSEADGLTQEAIEADLVSALDGAGGAVPAAGKADLTRFGVGSVERRDMDPVALIRGKQAGTLEKVMCI